MSSAGSYGGGGSGMAGVLTITGDTGLTVTGNITLTGLTSGSGISFNGTTTTSMETSIQYIAMSDAASDGSAGFVGVFGNGTIIAPWGGISSGNMFIGPQSGSPSNTGSQNIGIGQASLSQIVDAQNNIAIGYQAAQGCQSLTDNVAVGYQALASNGALGATGVGANVAIGANALRNGTAMVLNIAIGDDAGVNYATSESSNILIGNEGTVSDNNTIRIGTDGSSPGEQDACYIAGIYGQTIGGTNAAVFIDSTGKLGTVGGGGGGVTSITGDTGTSQTGALNITGGTSGALFNTSGSNITESFRFLAMSDTTSTTGYVQIGSQKVMACWGGVSTNNIFVGQGAGHTTVSGTDNNALGALALSGVTTGNYNIAIGSSALQVLTSSSQNVGVGLNSLSALGTGGGANTVVGFAAAASLSTGANNIILGSIAAGSYTTSESNNIVIGNDGVIADANTIRIGTQGSGSGQQNLCFIAGITGATITGGTAVLCDSNGQLGTVVSSERYKEQIHDVIEESLLHLRPVSFVMKNDATKTKQFGLIAEEVEKILPALVVKNAEGQPDAVKYHELPALLLKEIQRLNDRIKSLEEQFVARIR